MSNISGGTDGGSFISSDNTAAEGQKGIHFFHGSSKSPSSTCTTNSYGSASQTQQPHAAPKKKRNLPGTPDPNAEVVALSPETLMATNRFVCEICNKGFQRDQNLQLHRRGHNLPWKLKQRASGSEMKKRVYVCPEPSCVHHNPARALGDLTGIKKHFSRKHGEKKWKCDKCSKKYAVQSDLKAHSKTCGSKEYKCDCGTVFSRRDSFITHRAFCDALTEENNKLRQEVLASNMGSSLQSQLPELLPQAVPLINKNPNPFLEFSDPKTPLTLPHDLMPIPPKPLNLSSSSSNSTATIFERNGHQYTCSSGLMSATALLQKAAQMGAAVSSNVNSGTCMNSPMIHKGFVTTMAPSSFGGLIPQNIPALHSGYMQKCTQENALPQLSYDNIQNGGVVNLEMIDDISMLNGIFDQPHPDATRKKIESKSGGDGNCFMHGRKSSLGLSSGNTMTLDLLGTEAPKPRNFQEQAQQKQEEMGFGGFMENMNYFRHQAAMGRQTWEI